ncbi:hypothetical protein [Pseudomonas oryzihabitans]|uniref:hypothetical protein n=1 Tax=Pseudomonas oryzihabitans TaxID=47885 RepID=UPI00289830B2|nr:hypothetical protein [Pseudomonas oryzihabitans]
MRDFKPEDLALVTGFRASPRLVGLTVELRFRANPGETFIGPDGAWWVSKGQGAAWVVVVNTSGNWDFVEERHLMPLQGDAAPVGQGAKEQDHA